MVCVCVYGRARVRMFVRAGVTVQLEGASLSVTRLPSPGLGPEPHSHDCFNCKEHDPIVAFKISMQVLRNRENRAGSESQCEIAVANHASMT